METKNRDEVVSKQLYYLKKTLLLNLNYAEKGFLTGHLSDNDKTYIEEMNNELLDILSDVRDDYSRPSGRPS
tara:strand:+ start:196 stop:411 length:216 start_codon:yes stop_codon:yes gene_type:complete